MPTISTPELSVKVDVANADVTVTYTLTGSAYDIASGQPYRERVWLVGNDPEPPQSVIIGGQLVDTTVVFQNATAIVRKRGPISLPKANLNEDNGLGQLDEIRAKVELTPILPKTVTRESNEVVKQFG